jgi:integrase
MDMPRPRPPHLHRQTTRHGKTVWYVRLGHGLRIRLHREYGTEEFWAEYHAAVSGKLVPTEKTASTGTLAWAVAQYRMSTAWRALSAATRRQRENIFKQVLETAGRQPIARVDRKAIIAGRERRTVHQGRHFVDAMKGFFAWAVENDHVKINPAENVKTRKPPSDGFPVWTESDIAQYESFWPIGTRERLIFDLYLYTGLRRGDVARLGRQHMREGTLRITTQKNRVPVAIPVLPELQRSLDATPRGDLTFVVGADGKSMTKEGMANFFRDACRAAGIEKSGHGLRKAAATRFANKGASVSMLQALFGWTDQKMPSYYTRTADREHLAQSAVELLKKKT